MNEKPFTLWHGDCLELMKDIPDKSVDLVLCDLPYGTTACKWDTVIPFAPLWEAYNRICSGAVVLTASQPFTSALVMSNPHAFKYCWVWVKNRPVGAQHSRNQPMKKHEDICVFSGKPIGHASLLCEKRRMLYNPQGVKQGITKTVQGGFASHPQFMGVRPNQIGREYVAKTNVPNSVLEFSKDENHIHPTQKPVALMEYLIKTYTNPGMMVLDNCMGSGSVGVACLNTGRQFIGIEKDPEYFPKAKDRIESRWREIQEQKGSPCQVELDLG